MSDFGSQDRCQECGYTRDEHTAYKLEHPYVAKEPYGKHTIGVMRSMPVVHFADEREPCTCHGSWPLHADDQAAALRAAHQALEALGHDIADLRTALLEWWDDPDNPPTLAARLAGERDELGESWVLVYWRYGAEVHGHFASKEEALGFATRGWGNSELSEEEIRAPDGTVVMDRAALHAAILAAI